MDFLDKLLNQLAVKLILTPKDEFVTCEDDEQVGLLSERFEKFDLLPVSSERIQYFVAKSRAEKLCEKNHAVRVREAKQPISENNPISENEPIHKYLLRRGKPTFVTEQGEVVGIVTYADLNKTPSKMVFYVLISSFELLLIQSIKRLSLTDGQIEDCIGFRRWWEAKGRNERARRENYQLSLVECLDTGDLIDIACKKPSVIRLLDYKNEQEARKNLKPVEYLRNKIMHSGNLIIRNKEQLVLRRTQYITIKKHINDLTHDAVLSGVVYMNGEHPELISESITKKSTR